MTNNDKIYYAPIEIKDVEDLDNYGITWDDCKTLHFGASEKKTIYFFPTTNKDVADLMRADLNTEHSRGYRRVRCQVPGKNGRLISCPDTCKCASCPYGRKIEDRENNIISWDEILGMGEEDKELTARFAWMEFKAVKKIMDEKDPNIARAIVLKEMQGYEVLEIAEKLSITERQVYYCLQQAKMIGKKYKETCMER